MVASALAVAGAAVSAAGVSPPIPQVAAPEGSGCQCTIIPPLTRVSVEILEPLGSKTSKTGASFSLRLAAPIELNGRVQVPAGTTGVGEVVHAKRAGGTGTPGELVLAARYLEFGGRRLRLRSLNFSQAGENRYKSADTLAVAAAATVPGAALLVFAIKGKDIAVPSGTIAGARTAEPFMIAGEAPISIPDNATGEKE